MELKKFKLINNLLGVFVLLVASVTYLSTIEPTTSFWDCGEFIASSYKLEVGHPPGNPVFQLIARFFTLPAGPEKAAMMVNAMSAMCSAFTILFLFWTITHLGRRVTEKSRKELSGSGSLAIFGAGLVGALAYTFSDTFWFSAVEGEVYAMSSLFTAVVFWAMLKWEEEAGSPHANRWIVLIALLMGLSIGVHLLNLLAIPAIVFIYYYKNYEVSTKRSFYVLLVSAVILAVILYGIIPLLPKIASWVDLLFVNGMGFPFNSGAAFFLISILAASLWGIFYTFKKKSVLWNTILLSFTMIVIGYSAFAVVIIRSSANTPTNENQPDNPFSLVRYLAREQYGKNPLVYGESFSSPYDIKSSKYYAKVGDRYKKVDGPVEPIFKPGSKMLFPRMWSSTPDHIRFYESYTEGRGKSIQGSDKKLPLFKDNLAYFFDYQINYMYIRYFMWNFVGRQNDLHGTVPGDPVRGNWASGIGFIDNPRFGDQSNGPAYIVDSKAKNHYYFLPLLLGLIGLFYHLKKDKQNWWVTMLLFLLTGIAIVVYLNQPPYQARERDYAYAGSFYAFSIWIGLAVMAINDFIKRWVPEKYSALVVTAASLLVPVQMASENWDDHDRSNRYTARDIAYNYLNSTENNAILVTHGDNDTFPLWYIQEVEGVRTDVRIVNTSLLGTDWYIDQMQYRTYESDPLPISIPRSEYLYGTNDVVHIVDRRNSRVPLKLVIDLISKREAVIAAENGKRYSIFTSRKLTIPVNKRAAIENGIVSEADSSVILDSIELNISENKDLLTKTELIILDILANYQWDRPIYFVAMGGDLEIGIRDYLEWTGFAYKFVPIKSQTTMVVPGRVPADKMYDKVMNVYRWGNMNDPSVNIDYQNLLTFNAVMSVRNIHAQTARALFNEGKRDRAVEVLDRMQEVFIHDQFPVTCSIFSSLNEQAVIDAIDIYLLSEEREKALKLASLFEEESFKAIGFFGQKLGGYYLSKTDIERDLSYLMYLSEVLRSRGEGELADSIEKRVQDSISKIQI